MWTTVLSLVIWTASNKCKVITEKPRCLSDQASESCKLSLNAFKRGGGECGDTRHSDIDIDDIRESRPMEERAGGYHWVNDHFKCSGIDGTNRYYRNCWFFIEHFVCS